MLKSFFSAHGSGSLASRSRATGKLAELPGSENSIRRGGESIMGET